MRHIFLQQKAKQDLIQIWHYSRENWGESQADSYLDGVEATFQMLADNPQLGIACDIIAVGLKKFIHQKHLILYRDQADEIRIVRVLGASMDYEFHLKT